MAVVNDPSREFHLASLAINQLVGIGYLLLQGCRVSHQLEGRTWLIHIAHGVVLKQTRRGMAKIVWIEGGANGQRENLTGLRILNHHRSIQGMGALQRSIKGALGHELNIFVDGKNQILSRVRLALLAIEHVPAGVERGKHAAGDAVQIAVELAFHSA